MAKRGDTAREAVKNKIIEAFGEDFVAFVDKKIYVQASDGGEMIQFAITMTMPKNPIEVGENSGGSAAGGSVAPVTMPTELSSADKEKVNDLMAKLGLTTG